MQGNICVEAGAGTGKTFALVRHYLNLLEGKPSHNPLTVDNIIALTFTERAANEMRDRIQLEIEQRLEGENSEIWEKAWKRLFGAVITTFHSFCGRLIRENPFICGVDPGFAVLEESEAELTLSGAVRETVISLVREGRGISGNATALVEVYGMRGTANAIKNIIKVARGMPGGIGELREKTEERREGISGEESRRWEDAFLNVAEMAIQRYEEAKIASCVLDFDDLIIKGVNLLEKNPEALRRYRDIYRAVLVDEFQDTNQLQQRLVECISGESGDKSSPGRLFIVGDIKQSIYGWRDADIDTYSGIIESFREKEKIRLSKSRRSLPHIVDFVNRLFSQITPPQERPFQMRYDETCFLEKNRDPEDKRSVEIVSFGPKNEPIDQLRQSEAEYIARKIHKIKGKTTVYSREGMPHKAQFRDIALLFRAMTGSHIYENELRKAGIPYYIVKGRGFYKCKEVQELINALNAVLGEDEWALATLLRSSIFGLTDESLFRLKWAKTAPHKFQEMSLYDALLGERKFEDFSPQENERIINARRILGRLRRLRDRLSITEMLECLAEDTSYIATLAGTFQGWQKIANVQRMIEIARKFEARGWTVEDLMRYIRQRLETLPAEEEAPVYLESSECVKLMSIHQAKGLDFPIVFLADSAHRGKSASGTVLVSRHLGIGIKVMGDDGMLKPTPGYEEVKQELTERAQAEELRIAYVGCTRARDELIITGSYKREGNTFLEKAQSWKEKGKENS